MLQEVKWQKKLFYANISKTIADKKKYIKICISCNFLKQRMGDMTFRV